MNKTKKTTVFMFSILDYKAMEEYFEEMAAQGWMLEKISAVTAKFKKINPKKIKFAVDIFPYMTAFDSPNNRDARDYRELCEASGWHFVTSANKFQIFYANSDENPTPIQTDSIVEEKIIRKSVFNTELLIFLLCLPALLLGFGSLIPFDYSKLFTNISIVSTIYFPILIIPVAIYTGYYLFWFWKARRNIKKGLPLPRTSIRAARLRGTILLSVGVLLIILMFIAVIADIIGGYTFALYAFLLPIPGIAIGIWYKKIVSTKERSRGKNIAIFAVAIFCIWIVFTVFTFGLISSRGMFDTITGARNELTSGYIALELADFGIEKAPYARNFRKTSSLVVPIKLDYYEASSDGVIRTNYIRAINEKVAVYIFDGMLKREGSLIYRSVSEAPAESWNADKAYYLKDNRTMILLLKDEVVIQLDGKFDFSQPEIINVSKDKLKLK
ncbi:MAG: hypothetical protein APF76_09285 [Desulfitibacter sp. BRH_c19]|nr:MAG: hypothetical protein APF76_09285 [Desulfitibacter sp. BRH_c19]